MQDEFKAIKIKAPICSNKREPYIAIHIYPMCIPSYKTRCKSTGVIIYCNRELKFDPTDRIAALNTKAPFQ
jgi:hypothetical protein